MAGSANNIPNTVQTARTITHSIEKNSCAICLGYLHPDAQHKLHTSVSSRSASTGRDQWLELTQVHLRVRSVE